jgi:metal-sulfur cluster biosynthetic enzyme
MPDDKQTNDKDLSVLSREEKEALVRDALRSVLDPEIGLSVQELGLVRELDIQDDRMHMVMILTTPFCPYAPQLLEATRQKAQETLGVPTTIEVGMEFWNPSMAEEGILGDWGLF